MRFLRGTNPLGTLTLGPRASGDEDYGAGSGPCDVHSGGPGTPSLAVSGRHEGYRQSQVP